MLELHKNIEKGRKMRKISYSSWDKFISRLNDKLPEVNYCIGKKYIDGLGICSLNILPYRSSYRPSCREFFRLPLAGLIMRDESITLWVYNKQEAVADLLAQIIDNLLKDMGLKFSLEIVTSL